jgi:hypothetical protein
MAFAQDLLTRIVNIHGGGLAVEFGDKDENAPGMSSKSDELSLSSVD